MVVMVRASRLGSLSQCSLDELMRWVKPTQPRPKTVDATDRHACNELLTEIGPRARRADVGRFGVGRRARRTPVKSGR